MIITINVSAEDAWKWYSKLPEKLQKIAQYRFDRVSDVHALEDQGYSRTLALTVVCSEHEINASTLVDWCHLVSGEPNKDWLPQLVPTFSKTSFDIFSRGEIACPCCATK